MRRMICVFMICVLLAGCAPEAALPQPRCHLVITEGSGFQAEQYAQSVILGQDASFVLRPAAGYQFAAVDYPDYSIQTLADRQILTLHQVRYSVSLTVTYVPETDTIRYVGNGGLTAEEEPEAVRPAITTHLRSNTETKLFCRPGYTQLGWSRTPDGTGAPVGLGSRVALERGQTILYALWEPWSDPAQFVTAPNDTGLTVTGYTGSGDTLCIPGEIGGLPVTQIGPGAFAGAACRRVILPDRLESLGEDAFRNSRVRELYLFDNLRSIHENAFRGCVDLQTLHINAATPPRYSGTYFDTFQDKLDWLLSLAGEKKLVLFSGSSTRFGYDSKQMEKALPDYRVANMGVYAYTNALPQLRILLAAMEPGDLLLHSPEFDASEYQFCTTNALDGSFFPMMESNYDAVAMLDLRQYTQVFAALGEYLAARQEMPGKSYALSPREFDDLGHPSQVPTYNKYGDYVFYRPNAESGDPVYGGDVDYTVASFPLETYIAPLNRVYAEFRQKEITVLFTYAPRNNLSMTDESTPEARAALEAYFRDNLTAPVISELENSLYSGIFLYATDNHLSTEGVALRTEQILRDLKRYFDEN